jgi:hypothetical protein
MATRRAPVPRKPSTVRAQRPTVVRVREGRTRTYTLWTVDMLRAAQVRADRGDLSFVGSVCDALLGDDRFPSVLRTRVQGLLGLVPGFEASGDGRRKNRAVRALEAEEDWWDILPEDEHALAFSYALLAGVAPSELVYEEELPNGRTVARYRRGRLMPQLRFWHPGGLSLDDAGDWQMAVEGGGTVPVRAGDGQWVLWTPYGKRRPWIHGMWRGLSRWWLLKQYAIDDWGRYGEKGAQSVVESDKDAGVSKELRQDLVNSLFELARDGIIALPPGTRLKMLEATANTLSLYNAQIEAANTAMAVAALGHNLTSEVKGGSFAAADTGNDVRLDLRKFDAEVDSTTTHSQVLPWWATYNFGDSALAPWPVYPVDPAKDKKADADTLNVLGDAVVKLKAADDGVDVRAILESYEVPIVKGAPRPEDKPEPPDTPPPLEGGEGEDEPTDDDAPVVDATRARAKLAAATPKGAVRGQAYADALVAKALETALAAVEPDLADVAAAVDAADSYDALIKRLASLYAGMNPERFAVVVEQALVVAELAGRHAVLQDLDA